MALWLCSYVAMWLYGYVAMWLCGYQIFKSSNCEISKRKFVGTQDFQTNSKILVGYAQTAAVGSVLLIGSTMYTELSGRSGRLSFDRKVCLFVGCRLALRSQGMAKDAVLVFWRT